MKVIFDSSLTAIAAVIALLAFRQAQRRGLRHPGLRPFWWGQIVKFYTRRLGFIKRFLRKSPVPAAAS